MIIRPETPNDATAIEALTRAAFLNAPHTSHTEQFIVKALRSADQLTISLVAEDEGQLIGQVTISPVTISDGSTGWYGLGPISVLPEKQQQGIGSQLMRQSLAELRKKGATGCVVVGDPAYYQRFGFQADRRLIYPDLPAEYFMLISLRDEIPTGTVRFHAAFDAKE
jgi:putative acetyltransferase